MSQPRRKPRSKAKPPTPADSTVPPLYAQTALDLGWPIQDGRITPRPDQHPGGASR